MVFADFIRFIIEHNAIVLLKLWDDDLLNFKRWEMPFYMRMATIATTPAPTPAAASCIKQHSDAVNKRTKIDMFLLENGEMRRRAL